MDSSVSNCLKFIGGKRYRNMKHNEQTNLDFPTISGRKWHVEQGQKRAQGNIFFYANLVCLLHTVTAVPKRLLPGAQHWIIQADEQTWTAPSNLAEGGTAELQLELRGTPLSPVPLGCVALQHLLWRHLLSSRNNWTNEQ